MGNHKKKMQTAGDIKKAEKQAKKDALVKEFEDKKAKANAAAGVDKLKAWLDKPPYKSTNADVKKNTYMGVLNALRDISDADMEGMYSKLDIKEAAVLNKYFNLAYYYLNKQDNETKQLVQQPTLIKTQLKMQEVYGNAVIMKSAFIKSPVGWEKMSDE